MRGDFSSGDDAAKLIAERAGIDVVTATEALWQAGTARRIEIWGVPYTAEGRPISPAIVIGPAALAREVHVNGKRYERWSDGQLRPSRWHNIEVRTEDIDDNWPKVVVKKAKPGPKPKVLERVINEMRKIPPSELDGMKALGMETQFKASHAYVLKARKKVLRDAGYR